MIEDKITTTAFDFILCFRRLREDADLLDKILGQFEGNRGITIKTNTHTREVLLTAQRHTLTSLSNNI